MSGTASDPFFWNDWRGDPLLHSCSLATRGFWMEMLAIAAEAKPKGHVLLAGRKPTTTELARVAACTPEEVENCFAELTEKGVASRTRGGVFYSRRMVRDDVNQKQRSKAGKIGGRVTYENKKGIFSRQDDRQDDRQDMRQHPTHPIPISKKKKVSSTFSNVVGKNGLGSTGLGKSKVTISDPKERVVRFQEMVGGKTWRDRMDGDRSSVRSVERRLPTQHRSLQTGHARQRQGMAARMADIAGIVQQGRSAMTKSSSKRKERIRQKKLKAHVANDQDAASRAPERAYKPKRGPGQVFRRELIGAATGHAKRYRNIAASPLMLANERGDLAGPNDYTAEAHVRIIDADRFTAGEEFEKIWFMIHRAGSDSSIPRTGGGGGLFWTEAKEQASDKLATFKDPHESLQLLHHSTLLRRANDHGAGVARRRRSASERGQIPRPRSAGRSGARHDGPTGPVRNADGRLTGFIFWLSKSVTCQWCGW